MPGVSLRPRFAMPSGLGFWRRPAGSSSVRTGVVVGQQGRVVAIGDVMVEMARSSDGRFTPSCGGDTFNTAVYLARAGIPTAFATALGDDPFSDGILALAAA